MVEEINCPYCQSPLDIKGAFRNAIVIVSCSKCESWWLTGPNRFTRELKALLLEKSTLRERLFGIKYKGENK